MLSPRFAGFNTPSSFCRRAVHHPRALFCRRSSRASLVRPLELQSLDVLVELALVAERGADVGLDQERRVNHGIGRRVEHLVAGAARLAERHKVRADGIVDSP